MADTELQEVCTAQKTAIVVLNVDSLAATNVSGLAMSLGADAAISSMSADKGAIALLNESILHSSGDSNIQWTSFNKPWLASPKATEFLKKALKLIQSEFEDSHLMLFDDVGMARLLPFWNIVFEQAGIVPRYLFVMEDPADLAAILADRSDIDARSAHLIWLRTALDAELHSRGHLRGFIDPVALGEQPATVMENLAKLLGLTFPRNIHATCTSDNAFLAELRAQAKRAAQSDGEDNGRSIQADWVKVANMTFTQWAKEGETAEAQYLLDAVREAFDDAAPAFLGVGDISPGTIRRMRTLEQDLDEAQAEIARGRAAEQRLMGQVEQQEAQAKYEQTELKHRISHLESALAQRKAEVDDSERALHEARREISSLNREVASTRDAATEEVERLHQAARDATHANDEAQEQLRARYKEIVTLSRKLATEAAAAQKFERRAERLKMIAQSFEQGGARGRFANWLEWLLPWRWHLARINRRLERKGVFDSGAYLAANPDVARSGMDPLKHYLAHGMNENRPLGIE